MRVFVSSHPSFLTHDTGPRHPERPARVEAVRRGIEASGLETIDVDAPRIDRDELALVHDPEYIEAIESICSSGGGLLDMDTLVSNTTWEAGLRAVGAVRVLIDTLETESDATGFAICRPPGHHALPSRAMGFCIFNNVAVAALVLRQRGRRVAILDWDVHHGNGTQTVVAGDPGILYVSLHQDGFYPYEGAISDIEAGAKGTLVNIPLPAGTAGDVYRKAWTDLALPVVAQFEPDWVLVSAGYDAHVDDPLAGLSLTADDYGHLGATLAMIHPVSRIILALEGGYDLRALEESSSATLRGMAGEKPAAVSLHSPPWSTPILDRARAAVAAHWKL